MPGLYCYRCTFDPNTQTLCDSMLVQEACVIGPAGSSTQVNYIVSEYCNGQLVRTSEEFGFISDYLVQMANAGASCEEF